MIILWFEVRSGVIQFVSEFSTKWSFAFIVIEKLDVSLEVTKICETIRDKRRLCISMASLKLMKLIR